MNLVDGAPVWLVAVLLLALGAAAIEDAVRLRISNITCLVVFVAALVAAAHHHFPVSLWENLVVCVSIFVVGAGLYSKGWLGGGDVKLLAAIGLWTNLAAAVGLLAAVFLAGGLLGLLYLLVRRMTDPAPRARRKHTSVPYGLAIVSGALFVFGTQLSQKSANPYVDELRAQLRSAN